MIDILSRFPDPEILLALEPEEVAGGLIDCLRQAPSAVISEAAAEMVVLASHLLRIVEARRRGP